MHEGSYANEWKPVKLYSKNVMLTRVLSKSSTVGLQESAEGKKPKEYTNYSSSDSCYWEVYIHVYTWQRMEV